MLNNKLYNVLKWIVITALPALGLFLTTVLPLYGVEPNVVLIVDGTLSAFTALLGALIGVSSVKYNKTKAAEEGVQNE